MLRHLVTQKNIKGSFETYIGNSQENNTQYDMRNRSSDNIPFTVPGGPMTGGIYKSKESSKTIKGNLSEKNKSKPAKVTAITYIQLLAGEIKKTKKITHKDSLKAASKLWREAKEKTAEKDYKMIYNAALKLLP